MRTAVRNDQSARSVISSLPAVNVVIAGRHFSPRARARIGAHAIPTRTSRRNCRAYEPVPHLFAAREQRREGPLAVFRTARGTGAEND